MTAVLLVTAIKSRSAAMASDQSQKLYLILSFLFAAQVSVRSSLKTFR
jgi:hypothetical protein